MKPQLLLLAILLATSLNVSAQVSISTDGSSPDPSAMLDVKSTNKGMLIPRVALTAINVAAPIASPAVGLLVYNTAYAGTPPNNVTQGFYCWKGTRWFAVTMPQGTTNGDMLYWDGTQWSLVPSGEPSQILRLCNGVPTWGPCIPSITTTPVSTITATSVVSGGNITNDGGEAVTARGVCWNTAGSPTTVDSFTEDGSGTGAFASEVTGLSSGVVYYLRAYASNNTGTAYGDEIITCTEGSDSLFCAGIPVISHGGQTYHTVKIGTQCWMKENLNIGNMINGSLPQTDNQVVEKYCYGNSAQSCVVWGGLYQWNELMNYSTQEGSRGICPSGWHVPSDGEFCTMSTYLDPTVNCQTMDWTGANAGGNMKETGTAHWNSPNGGATNSSGYTGLGGGYSSNGSFGLITLVGHWWTSSTDGTNHVLWEARCNDALAGRYKHQPELGFSVRCVKDPLPVITTSAVTDITTETASCGGGVVSDGGATVTERGICWNTTGAPTIADSFTTDGSGTGMFTSQITGLQANTTYFVRAYATSSNGTAYGNQEVFTTLQVVVPTTAWELAGNTGTDPSVNFIGTTDTSSLIFRVNNFRSGMLDINRWNASWGYHALTRVTGTSNTALGHYCLEMNTTGSSNTAVGNAALPLNTIGNQNTAIGNGAMMLNVSGYENTAIGSTALMNNQVGIDNVAVGHLALASSFGSYNTAIGILAGYLGGSSNVFIGPFSGYNDNGNNKLYFDNRYRDNIQAGMEQSLIYGVFAETPANQKLTFNASVGIGTISPSNRLHIVSTANPLRLEGLQTTTNEDFLVVDEDGVVSKRSGTGAPDAWELTGNWGTNPEINFIGTNDYAPLTFRVHNEPSGIIDVIYQNTAFGNLSFFSNTTGSGNSALGYKALHSNTTGTENTATGKNSLNSNTEGSGNTAYGTSALYYNTIGSSNTATGFVALRSNTVGEENCAVGYLSLFNNISGNSNTAIGCSSLSANTTGHSNVAIGVVALNANTTRSNLVAIGDSSLYNNGFGATETFHATQNTAVGSKALYANTNGYYNTAMGFHALYSNTTGHRNTAVGDGALFNNSAGSSNTAIGSKALYTNVSGINNIALGYYAGYYETGSNKLYIDSQERSNEAEGREKSLIYGVFDADPDNQQLTMNANIGINAVTPDASAVLDVSSTTKGFLPPRMTTSQITAIASPSPGLIVYDSTINKMQYYDGTAWRNIDGSHYVGETYGGGKVFYVYDNGHHGLIAATTDESSGLYWTPANVYTGATGDGINSGDMNTTISVAIQVPYNPSSNFAAKACADYSVVVDGVNYGDWYLPSKYELNILYQQKDVVGGFNNNYYWSSNEYDNNLAWCQQFSDGSQTYLSKYFTYLVRAIRAF